MRVLLASFLLLGIAQRIGAESLFEHPVKFDPKLGGLTARIGVATKGGNIQHFDNTMLSTVNSRTFFVDAAACDETKIAFCKERKNKYSLASPPSGETPTPFTKLPELGKYIVQTIQIGELPVSDQQIGLMNDKAEEDVRFWGIVKDEKTKEVTKPNMADGCVSLKAGSPEEPEDFGKVTPLENVMKTAFPDPTDPKKKTELLLQKIVSIRMDKTDKMMENAQANGKIMFGALLVDDQCHSWSAIKKSTEDPKAAPMDPWTFKLDGIDGVAAAKDLEALIDTSSEQITLPKPVFDELTKKQKLTGLNAEECSKLGPIKFMVGGLVYAVPAAHYMTTTKDGCHSLIAESAEEHARVHLGLPFLRSTCVAADIGNKAFWLSGGVCAEQQHGGDDGKHDGKSNSAASASIFGSLLGLLLVVALLL